MVSHCTGSKQLFSHCETCTIWMPGNLRVAWWDTEAESLLAIYWEISLRVVYYSGNCWVLQFLLLLFFMYCILLTSFPFKISIGAVFSMEFLTHPQPSFSLCFSLKMASALFEIRRAEKSVAISERPLVAHGCKHILEKQIWTLKTFPELEKMCEFRPTFEKDLNFLVLFFHLGWNLSLLDLQYYLKYHSLPDACHNSGYTKFSFRVWVIKKKIVARTLNN